MEHSYAQSINIECPYCGASLQAEIWLIIDTAEHPDLVERIRNKSIFDITCPRCRNTLSNDAPMLVYLPDQSQHLLFVPSDSLSFEANEQQLASFWSILKNSLSDIQRNEAQDWAVQGVPRNFLPEAIDDPESALRQAAEYAQQGEPEEHDSVQASAPLEQILRELLQPAYPADMHRRAQLCRVGLTLVDPQTSPEYWIMFQGELGNSLLKDPEGDHAENVEQAIDAHQKALQLIPQQTKPDEWAMMITGLAIAYTMRELGERADNFEKAIDLYQQALQVRTRQSRSEAWARTMLNLANAYQERIAGEKADNLEQAINLYQQSLQELSPQSAPQLWGKTMVNLANTYKERIRGEKADNLELALTACQQALQVFFPQSTPYDWAKTTAYLADMYQGRIRGEKAENLEQAIALYQQALEIQTPQSMPTEWATTMIQLAEAYYNRIRGEKAENLERSIDAYQQVLRVFTRQSTPQRWARVMMDLANGYTDRILGERAENLERAIDCFQQVLEVRTRQSSPIDWAKVMYNLASAYLKRIRGERANNLEQAIDSCEQALEVQTRESLPQAWALTMMALGTAFRNRILGPKDENIEKAIEAYQQALQVFTPQSLPIEWARTLLNLATAYSDRVNGDKAENLEQAIACLQQALQVFTPQSLPIEWAHTMLNLGVTFAQRLEDDKAENLEQAIVCFQQALQVFTPQSLPIEWARTMLNLAGAFRYRIKGEQTDNEKLAIDTYQQALVIFLPNSLPIECRFTARNLGDLHFKRGDWTEAYRAYTTALQAAENLYRSDFIPESQQIEIETNADLHDHMIMTCIPLSEDTQYARDALLYAESGKARTFLDQMGQADFPPLVGLPTSLRSREEDLISQLRQTEQALAATTSASLAGPSDIAPAHLVRQLATQRQKLREDLEVLWDTMISSYPEARDYVSLRRGQLPNWESLARLASTLGSHTALIEFYTREDEILAFILHERWDAPRILTLPISSPQLFYRYLTSYQEEVILRQDFDRTGRKRKNEWLKLGEKLLWPLEDALAGVDLVYVVPHGLLHLLPLHALTVQGEPFISRYAVIYAPSIAVLQRVLERNSTVQSDEQALVMGYTPSTHPEERLLFLGEAQAIADLFRCQPFLDTQASVDTLRKHAPTATTIHLSCHGIFDPSEPLESLLLLAQGNFTARQWMELRLHADLVTLSACQTGINEVGRGDEVVGLSRALLYAGASTTLLTLWSVNAATTLEWMMNFYDHMRVHATGNVPPKVFAFQQATLALREKYGDPYYWAPFTLVGHWH